MAGRMGKALYLWFTGLAVVALVIVAVITSEQMRQGGSIDIFLSALSMLPALIIWLFGRTCLFVLSGR